MTASEAFGVLEWSGWTFGLREDGSVWVRHGVRGPKHDALASALRRQGDEVIDLLRARDEARSFAAYLTKLGQAPSPQPPAAVGKSKSPFDLSPEEFFRTHLDDDLLPFE